MIPDMTSDGLDGSGTDARHGAPGAPSCPNCWYDLSGLAEAGACPECGAAYTARTRIRVQPMPGQLNLALRLGWPLLGIIFSMVGMSLGESMMCAMFAISAAMILAVFVNTPVVLSVVIGRHIPPAERSRSLVVNIFRMGLLPVVVLLINGLLALGAVIGLGTCLIMVSR